MKKNISRNPLWPDWYNGKIFIKFCFNLLYAFYFCC